MKYGIIGTGWITESFIAGAATIQGMELTAVYSRNLDKGRFFAAKFNVQTVYDSLEEMVLGSTIDAVYIASPNSLHYEQSKLFLQHGKHVLCEKPIGVSSEQVKELVQLAQTQGLIYMEAIMMRHLPARVLLHQAVGRLGNISLARFDYSQLSSKYPAYLKGEVPNIFNPQFATGCLMDLGIYCVYPALDLFGYPDNITASAGFLSTGADGYGSSLLQYKDKLVNLSYSKVGESYTGSEIMGDKGTLVIGSVSQLTRMKIIWNDGQEELLEDKIPKHILMSGEAKSFYNYIRHTEEYAADYESSSQLAIQVSQVMEEIRRQAGINFAV